MVLGVGESAQFSALSSPRGRFCWPELDLRMRWRSCCISPKMSIVSCTCIMGSPSVTPYLTLVAFMVLGVGELAQFSALSSPRGRFYWHEMDLRMRWRSCCISPKMSIASCTCIMGSPSVTPYLTLVAFMVLGVGESAQFSALSSPRGRFCWHELDLRMSVTNDTLIITWNCFPEENSFGIFNCVYRCHGSLFIFLVLPFNFE